MGKFDALFTNLTSSILASMGGRCSIKFVDSSGYDYLGGQKAPKTPQIWSNIPCSPPYPYKKSQINGTSIQQDDFQLVVPSKDLQAQTPPCPEPTIKMTVLRSNHWFQIVSVDPINSGDADVAYVLQCRK